MSTAEQYMKNLHGRVAWDGHDLTDWCQLPNDLSFRAAVSEAVSPGEPIDANTLNSFLDLHGMAFHEVLHEAIRSTRKEVVAWAEENQHLAPDDDHGTPAPDSGPTRSQLWAARRLVFQKLVAMPEFKQLYREFRARQRQSRRWLSRILAWGEPKRQSEQRDEPSRERPASVWGPLFRETYRPLMQGIMYVLPVAIGTQFVASSIIEKQSVMRSEESRTIRESDVRNTAEFTSSISRVTTDIENLQSSNAILDSTVKTLVSKVEQHRTDNNVPINRTVTLKLDPTLQDAVLGLTRTPPPSFQVSFSPDTFHIKLANDGSSASVTSTATGKSASPTPVGFLLNVGQSDLNVHEGPYPIPAQAQPPFVKALQKGLPLTLGWLVDGQIIPAAPPPNPASTGVVPKVAVVLCDDSVPYRFYLRIERDEKQAPPTCRRPENSARLVFLTEVDQYISEANANIKVDTVSAPRIFGTRRVAVRITPLPSASHAEGKAKPEQAAMTGAGDTQAIAEKQQ
jgi:hypothetical protein